MPLESVPGNLDLRVAAGLSGIYGSDNSLNVPAQHGPLRVAEHNERNFPNCQVLLVTHVLVGSDDHCETGFLGGL